MLVNDFRLMVNNTPVKFVRSPNFDPALQETLFVILHYTCGPSQEVAVNWLANPASKVSAHLVIGRSGEITQLVPFNAAAWHAGLSNWKGYQSLNRYAIGIELDNAGMMQLTGNRWVSSFGKAYPDNEVMIAAHEQTPNVMYGWHKYTSIQLQTAAEVVAALVQAYGIREILGHADIAPKRKLDPGPAFPMEAFRMQVAARVAGLPGLSLPVDAPERPQPAHYQVEDLESGLTTEYAWQTAFKPVNLLPVPYVSQLGTGADLHRNDCGAAAAIMLLRAYLDGFTLTPDEFYTRFAVPGPDPYLSVTQLRNALGSLGLLTDFKAGLSTQDLFAALAQGKPAIVLLRYKVFEEAGLTEKHFEGPHFAVVVGMDIRHVYLHDPLYTNPVDGNAHAYPLDLFWKAWKEVAADSRIPNPECSAILPTAGIGYKLSRPVRVNVAALAVRSIPENVAATLRTLKRGETVEVVREMSGWGEISSGGWVYLAYTIAA